MTQQLLLFSPTKVGTQFVLWKTKISDGAYTDQFGRKHTGRIVYEEVLITVVEQRTVPGQMGISEFTTGYRALAEDGRELHKIGSEAAMGIVGLRANMMDSSGLMFARFIRHIAFLLTQRASQPGHSMQPSASNIN